MADEIKVLGQAYPAAATPTTLYTVPDLRSTTTSSLVICNQTAGAITFRVNVRVEGLATESKQYLYYDQSLAAYTTFSAVLGMTLEAGDIVEVYSTTQGISFNLFGVETY